MHLIPSPQRNSLFSNCCIVLVTLLSLAIQLSPSYASPSNMVSNKLGMSKLDSDEDALSAPGDVEDDSSELAKRLSGFVRIGRPSSFVRIGRGSRFVRIGRPGSFIRIGRNYQGDDLEDTGYDHFSQDLDEDKRAPGFVRIGKSNKFLRVVRGSWDPHRKRYNSFVRIGKSDPMLEPRQQLDVLEAAQLPLVTKNSNNLQEKRAPSFVRIGRIPSSAFVRIGRNNPSTGSEESPVSAQDGSGNESNVFDRIARMGQSSFVRIGKRSADPEKMEQTVEKRSQAN